MWSGLAKAGCTGLGPENRRLGQGEWQIRRIPPEASGMALHVRDYRKSDRKALIALWEACGLTRPWNEPGADIDRAVAARESTILIGVLNKELISSVMAGYDGHRGWVYYLAVASGFQKRGYAREMMAEAGLWLAARGAVKIQLMVRDENQDAARLYEALGFERQAVAVYGKWLKEGGTEQPVLKKASDI